MTTLFSALHSWAVTHGRPVTPTSTPIRNFILHNGGFPVLAVIGIVVAVILILLLVALLAPWGGSGMRRRHTVIESGSPGGIPGAGGTRTTVYEDEVV